MVKYIAALVVLVACAVSVEAGNKRAAVRVEKVRVKEVRQNVLFVEAPTIATIVTPFVPTVTFQTLVATPVVEIREVRQGKQFRACH